MALGFLGLGFRVGALGVLGFGNAGLCISFRSTENIWHIENVRVLQDVA